MIVGRGFFSGSANRNDRLANAGASTPIRNYGGNMGYKEDYGAGRVNNVRPKPGVRIQDVYGIKQADAGDFSGGGVNVASADTSTFDRDDFQKYYNAHGFEGKFDSGRHSPIMIKMLRDNHQQDIKELRYRDGQFLNRAKPEGNPFTRFAGSLFNAVTGTQPAAANVLDGKIDFGSAVREIGNLPSDYKATEAAAFRAAENFRRQVAADERVQGIIDRNPRLTRGADGSVKAVQQTRAEAGASANTAQGNRARVKANSVARAKAMAANRISKGQSASQSASANKASMKAAAKKRHSAFKKKRAQKKNNKK